MDLSSASKQNNLCSLQSLRKHQEKQLKLSSYDRLCGIVRGQWKKEDGKLQTICYGSGIAISKRVILTCAHSVYLEHKQKICDSISFIPDHDEGKIKSDKIFKSSIQDFIKLETLSQNKTFKNHAVIEDIALIYLSEDIDLDYFPEVGVQNVQSNISLKNSIRISGYPSSDYYSCPDLLNINFKRESLEGDLLQIKDCIIYHNLPTKTGHSGSGILGRNINNNKVVVLGVHTHKGRSRNSGVYLTNFLLQRLARYQIQFGLKHSEYDMSIKFPPRIKEKVFLQLGDQDRYIILSRNKFYEEILQMEEDGNNSEMSDFYFDDLDEEKRNIADKMQEEALEILFQHKKTQVVEPYIIFSDERLLAGFAENDRLKKQLFQDPRCDLDLMEKWVKIENSFLKIISTSFNIKYSPSPQQQDLNRQLINMCKDIEQQLSQIKQKVLSNLKVDEFSLKFMPVVQHLAMNFANYVDKEIIPVASDQKQQDCFLIDYKEFFKEMKTMQRNYHSQYGKNSQQTEDLSKMMRFELQTGKITQRTNLSQSILKECQKQTL